MRRVFLFLAVFCPALLWSPCAAPSRAQQTSPAYDLRGEVLNSVTGKPVAGALVQIYGGGRWAQFSNSDGAFVFSGLPPGQYPLIVRKPGFFSERGLGQWRFGGPQEATIPSDGHMVLKLMPQGVIYGQVTDENNQPIEGIQVRLERWQIVEGHKQLEFVNGTQTNDQGSFRIARLRPATYFLCFKSANAWHDYNIVGPRAVAGKGYGTEFYPGVSDLASATPIPIHFGSQVNVQQSLALQPTYQVSGTVVGAGPALRGVMLRVLDAAGDSPQNSVHLDRGTGHFQISGVPAGSYVLLAEAWIHAASGNSAEQRRLSAALPISVTADTSGLLLALGPGVSIPIRIDDETSHDAPRYQRQVYLRMTSELSRNFSRSMGAALDPRDQGRPAVIEDLFPGAYQVDAQLNGPGYVAALRCGDVDLLRSDLTVGATGSLPPIDVTVRDDGAQLSGTVAQNGRPAAAGVVIYSANYPNRSRLVRSDASGCFSVANLAPGDYEVLALQDPENLEYRNPAAMQDYLGRATSVTLSPSGQSAISLELSPEGGDQP